MTDWFDRALTPVLPLIYVAWSDGTLTADEIAAIRAVGGRWGAPDKVLDAWLDPDRPPAAAALADLRARLQRVAPPGAQDLVEMGLALAEQHGIEVDPLAVQRTAEALHLHHPDAASELLPRPTHPREWPAVQGDPERSARIADALAPRWPKDRADAIRAMAGFERILGEETLARRARVTGWLQALADEGLFERSFPTTAPDGAISRFMAMFDAFATFDLSLTVKAGVQIGLFGGSIYFLGSDRHRARYLPEVVSLRLPGCFAMTERGHGSNVRELETTATYDHARRCLVVHTPHDRARKEWIGNAARDGRMATVFAQLIVDGVGHGVHAVLVPIRDADGRICAGVRVEDCGEKMGLHGVDNGQIWFDQVEVPVANLLDRFAQIDADGQYQSPIASPARRFFTMLGTLVGGRVSVAGAAVAVAQSALTIAVRYAVRRRQFGPRVGEEVLLLDHVAHQHKLLPRLATTVCLSVAREGLKDLYDQVQADPAGPLERILEVRAAGLKAYATRFATDTVQICREACGGQGYAAANRFAALKADSDVFTTFEGDNTVLEMLVARGLLADFKQQFADSRLGGLLRVLARRAGTALSQRNPITTRLTGAEHLRDAANQLELLRARRDHRLDAVVERVQALVGAGVEPFEAINRCQLALSALATADTELWILEQAQPLSAADPVLALAVDLFALGRIEADLAWFMTRGYLEAGKAEAIQEQVEALCRDLRPHAVALVDAFDIDDHRLGAPIGRRA